MSLIFSAATIRPIHVFSSAFSAFLSANILRARVWRSCNPGPTLRAGVTAGTVTFHLSYIPECCITISYDSFLSLLSRDHHRSFSVKKKVRKSWKKWLSVMKSQGKVTKNRLFVMTTLRKVLDFIFFLPFLFSLYHYPEPSRTFYDDPLTSTMMHTPEHSSMT